MDELETGSHTPTAAALQSGDTVKVTAVRESDRNYYRLGATGIVKRIDAHDEPPDALIAFTSGLLSQGEDGCWWVPLDNLEKMG